MQTVVLAGRRGIRIPVDEQKAFLFDECMAVLDSYRDEQEAEDAR